MHIHRETHTCSDLFIVVHVQCYSVVFVDSWVLSDIVSEDVTSEFLIHVPPPPPQITLLL